ncbi:MAG: mucoidy inhibitor MuiA family protein [Bacteroidota bacterium]
MKNLIVLLFLVSGFGLANDKKVTSKIEEVTVYLSGAQITRTAQCQLSEGSHEVVFTGLSHKIDESSIQVSGLYGVSILSIAYDINYLEKSESNPLLKEWKEKLKDLDYQITLLKNTIYGLEEEEKVITTNRMVSTDNQALNLEKVKEISQYYRIRLTAIKNEIFENNRKINTLKKEVKDIQLQMAEVNNAPAQEQGEITIKFDAPIATRLSLTLKYLVKDAGWVPNYDIKSKSLNAPLTLAYKANVYQNTGKDWNDVAVVLSTGNPDYNISKPELQAHYLNFTSAYTKKYAPAQKKKGYAFNPAVKKVAGTITDASGQPLPGVNVVIKGTNKGTQTDFNGNYELEVPFGQELSFSYIGMHSQDIPLYSSIINLSMEEDPQMLEEVVIAGYGTKRNDFTGAVSSISPAQLIQGRAAGVNIRGTNSISSNKTPLYIIDGVPTDGFVEGDLDASEIQSIDILKGADASALYGNRGVSSVVVITTKKSSTKEGATKTEFVIKKSHSIPSDNDITAIEINTFKLPATYEYFAAPIINENVFLTASFTNWEQHQLLPGEANIYFEGTYAGKTVLDPYTTKKEIVLSLGIDPNITVTRKQERNFKSKSFTGSNRILNRTYNLEVKNNKGIAIELKVLDRVPKSENKEIKVDDLVLNNAEHDSKKGLLTWRLKLQPQQSQTEQFSFQVKYPRGKNISL